MIELGTPIIRELDELRLITKSVLSVLPIETVPCWLVVLADMLNVTGIGVGVGVDCTCVKSISCNTGAEKVGVKVGVGVVVMVGVGVVVTRLRVTFRPNAGMGVATNVS